jgi:magnesium-transporting ATPase (P-type)
MDTAVNVGYTCHLLKENTKVLRIVYENIEDENEGFESKDRTQETEEEKKERLTRLMDKKLCEILFSLGVSQSDFEKKEEDLSKNKRNKETTDVDRPAIVLDGVSIGIILSNDRLVNLFLHLTDLCYSVICCRTSPLQKV